MVRVIMALEEPSGITVDESDPMDAYVAEVAVGHVREGLMWDASRREFSFEFGVRIARARIEPIRG